MRNYIRLATLFTLIALSFSCVREKEQDVYKPKESEVTFVFDNLSARSGAESVRNRSYRLGSDEEGNVFTLLETVTELDGAGPEPAMTRGTPVYTENVASVYRNMLTGTVYNGSSLVAGDEGFDEFNGVWRRDFGRDIWPAEDPLTFYLRMPSSATGLSNLVYGSTAGSESISFDYETPSTASEQQDIIFAIRSLDKATFEREKNVKGGASVLLRHALTGVKFAIGNNTSESNGIHAAGDIQTFIKRVEFTGLKDKGHAVFVPDDSVEQNEDIDDVHSSVSSFTWTYEGASTETSFVQTYGDEDVVSYQYGDAVGAPYSFYAGGVDHNLNDADASLTFWFIPQQITSEVKLKVTFYVWYGNGIGEDMELTLDLGDRILEQVNREENPVSINLDWLPGQLRTFTLTPTTVDVDIEDEIVANVKQNVVVRNTGNKDAYMRVAIVGNWADSDGVIVMGVTDSDTGEYTAIPAWNESQGTFTLLGGPSGEWVKKADGFWYYTSVVAPGATPSVPVFGTYTPPAAPAGTAGLIMYLSVQAVDAAAGADYEAAWAAALPGAEDEGDDGDGE